ncbi:MAG: hypothetical protein HYU37_01480 [Acidobacteria bacterium]|nr:hypothetical protein [Acidobacteriota bacterium]
MAKSDSHKRTRPQGAVGLKRRPIAKDEKLLSPLFVDFSTIVFSGETIIQDFFQTAIPVGGSVPREGSEVDVVLVARFVYSPDFFRALMSLLVRQYAAFEDIRGRKDEGITWLRQLLKQVESGDSTESPEPSTLQ